MRTLCSQKIKPCNAIKEVYYALLETATSTEYFLKINLIRDKNITFEGK